MEACSPVANETTGERLLPRRWIGTAHPHEHPGMLPKWRTGCLTSKEPLEWQLQRRPPRRPRSPPRRPPRRRRSSFACRCSVLRNLATIPSRTTAREAGSGPQRGVTAAGLMFALGSIFCLETSAKLHVFPRFFWALTAPSPLTTFKVASQSYCPRVVAVAQLVRASDCGSEGRGFKSPQPPLLVRCGIRVPPG